MKNNIDQEQYVEVWGDSADLKELIISCFIGVILALGLYIVGTKIFQGIDGLDEGLQKGYALLIGVAGCILAIGISAKLFKPKRVIVDHFEQENIEVILNDNGISLEEEAEALGKASREIIEELEDLELWALLALIPENSPNYKAEYKQKEEGNK